jgi:hypothetical protein
MLGMSTDDGHETKIRSGKALGESMGNSCVTGTLAR